MEAITNVWIVSVTEEQITQMSVFRDEPVTPNNAHAYVSELIHTELAPGGLYEAIFNAAVNIVTQINPHLTSDENWPENTSIEYANVHRGHFTPGAEDLNAVSMHQPPNSWVARVYLTSNIKWPALLATINPLPHPETGDTI